ncbi:MAG: type II secretion system F family protein [Planctomycetia bacterium]|nr:type II secretion system F family protein [Planctomycetia bacterium]
MGVRLDAFYRSLAHLEAAGIPWPRAVEMASGGDPAWAPAVADLRAGRPLSEAFDGRVPALDLAGVRAAEVAGRLEATFLDLARRAEETMARERARRAAVAYPFAIAHFAAVLMPVPDLVAGNLGAALGWTALILGPLYAWLAYRRAATRALDAVPRGGRAPAWTAPLRTRAWVEEADARALRALGWLHDAGVPLLDAVPLAAHAGAGGRMADDLVDAWAAVRAGQPLATAWRRVPHELAATLATGEQTGHLAEACAHEAASLEGIAALRREKRTALLKPLMIVLVGLVIGARVISFYAGMLSKAGIRR